MPEKYSPEQNSPADGLQSLFHGCGFSWFMLLSRWAFICDVCPMSRRTACNDLQGGSALPIRSHCGAVWGVSGHNFIWDARAMPHKKICDFAGNDRDGNLHNKSSHARSKIANKVLLYFQRTACFLRKPRCSCGGAFAPRSGLPSFRSSRAAMSAAAIGGTSARPLWGLPSG